MLILLLTFGLARATAIDQRVVSRAALLQLVHRLGHPAPLEMNDPDRVAVYGLLRDANYRGEVFRVVEACGAVAPSARAGVHPALDAFARDGFGDSVAVVREKLLNDLVDPRGGAADELARRLARQLVTPSPATARVFTAAFQRAQIDLVTALGRTRTPAAAHAVRAYLRGLQATYGAGVSRAAGFHAALDALVSLESTRRPCDRPLSTVPPAPRRSWWRNLFRRGGPT